MWIWAWRTSDSCRTEPTNRSAHWAYRELFHFGFDDRELFRRVDAQRLASAGGRIEGHRHVAVRPFQDTGTVGQVILALGIVGRQLLERRQSRSAGWKTYVLKLTSVIARWLGRGVLLFDDCRELAVRVADDAAQPGRIRLSSPCPTGRPAARRRTRPAAPAATTPAPSASRRRGSAPGPRAPPARPRHIIDRVAGAELLGLLDELEARLAGQFAPDQIGPVADDDDESARCRPPARRRSRSGSSAGRTTGTSTLGKSEPIRLPLPAARMIASGSTAWSRQRVARGSMNDQCHAFIFPRKTVFH